MVRPLSWAWQLPGEVMHQLKATQELGIGRAQSHLFPAPWSAAKDGHFGSKRISCSGAAQRCCAAPGIWANGGRATSAQPSTETIGCGLSW